MKKRGILTVVSGFAGAGKGSTMKGLLEKYADRYALSVSVTTRAPRPGEEEGKAYYFRTKEQFEEMITNDELIEYANYVGNYYGTPKEYVEKQLEEGKDVILEIEIQGALKVKERMPDTVLLFISPPSAKELKRRLIGRGTEDLATIQKRLYRASEESEGIEKYDYFVINDSLEDCVEEVHMIIQSEKSRIFRNKDLINQIRNEVYAFRKEIS